MLKKDTESRIREVEIELEDMNRQSKAFFEELDITPDEIRTYTSNRENFSDETWEALHKTREDLDHKLSRSLQNINNPKLAQRRRRKLKNVGQTWIPVR